VMVEAEDVKKADSMARRIADKLAA